VRVKQRWPGKLKTRTANFLKKRIRPKDDIGVFLHFQEDSLLKNILFLKPNCSTAAVYKILDHPLLNTKNGRFNRRDAKQIWHEEEYIFIRDELLRLMQKFFLTYEIENTGEY
jgi:internalin A